MKSCVPGLLKAFHKDINSLLIISISSFQWTLDDVWRWYLFSRRGNDVDPDCWVDTKDKASQSNIDENIETNGSFTYILTFHVIFVIGIHSHFFNEYSFKFYLPTANNVIMKTHTNNFISINLIFSRWITTINKCLHFNMVRSITIPLNFGYRVTSDSKRYQIVNERHSQQNLYSLAFVCEWSWIRTI